MDWFSYNDLIQDFNSYSQIKIKKNRLGLSMANHDNPVSITETEFNYLLNFIKDNKLQSGYECATAFGISSLAAGIGFAEVGSHTSLVTMDSYIEEQFNKCDTYDQDDQKTYKDSDGYNLAGFLHSHFRVEHVVSRVVGWSPKDIPNLFTPNDKLDYVFIDALHTNHALLRDIEGIKPYLADRFALFIHDIHCFSDATKDYISCMLGGEIKRVLPNDGTNYGLACVNKL